MASVNKAIILGNLGKDPELKFTPNGKNYAHFSVATTEKWRDGNGNQQEHTEWHYIECWGKQAENCCQYLHKGSAVYIEGAIRANEYTDKEGIKRYQKKIVSQRVQFLGSKPQSNDGERFYWESEDAF